MKYFPTALRPKSSSYCGKTLGTDNLVTQITLSATEEALDDANLIDSLKNNEINPFKLVLSLEQVLLLLIVLLIMLIELLRKRIIIFWIEWEC